MLENLIPHLVVVIDELVVFCVGPELDPIEVVVLERRSFPVCVPFTELVSDQVVREFLDVGLFWENPPHHTVEIIVDELGPMTMNIPFEPLVADVVVLEPGDHLPEPERTFHIHLLESIEVIVLIDRFHATAVGLFNQVSVAVVAQIGQKKRRLPAPPRSAPRGSAHPGCTSSSSGDHWSPSRPGHLDSKSA